MYVIRLYFPRFFYPYLSSLHLKGGAVRGSHHGLCRVNLDCLGVGRPAGTPPVPGRKANIKVKGQCHKLIKIFKDILLFYIFLNCMLR